MLYKRGDKIRIKQHGGYYVEFDTETTVLSYNEFHHGYAVDPVPLGKSGWIMEHSRLEYYPEAIVGEPSWFVGSECVIGLAYETVVIDTVD